MSSPRSALCSCEMNPSPGRGSSRGSPPSRSVTMSAATSSSVAHRHDEMGRGRPEVLDVRVREHRHRVLAGEVGAEDHVVAVGALQQVDLGRRACGRSRRSSTSAAADPSHVVDRHGVLGVVPQRQREAHPDAAARGVDGERRLGGDGDLRRVDVGERLRRGDDEAGTGCRDRRRGSTCTSVTRGPCATLAARPRGPRRRAPRRRSRRSTGETPGRAAPARVRAAGASGGSVLIRVRRLVDLLDEPASIRERPSAVARTVPVM